MEKKIKKEEGIPTTKRYLVRFPNVLTDISDDKKKNPKAYSTSTSSNESEIRRYGSRSRERRCRRYRTCRHLDSLTLSAHKQEHSEFDLNFLVPVIERYQEDLEYCSYRFIHKISEIWWRNGIWNAEDAKEGRRTDEGPEVQWKGLNLLL